MKRTTKTWLLLLSASCFFVVSCSKIDFLKHERDKLPNDVIIQWNLVALQAEGGVTYGNPLVASHTNAMVHLAMHDALNAINPHYEQYAYKTTAKYFADPISAAATAAYTVLLGNFPESKSMLDSALQASLSTIANGVLKEQGMHVGSEAGKAMLALRAGDGAFDNPVSFIPVSTVPGVYNVTPPSDFIFGYAWRTMKLFSLQSHDQFRPIPPPALTSDIYTRDFNEIKSVGSLNSTTRTADESAYAKWWYEFVELGWNRVARIKARDEQTGLYQTARLFAHLNMAIADSYTVGFDSKYFFNFWRPLTAIRAAATDGNNATEPDPNWLPAEPTPPVPDYPSTHSVGANAAATVLTYYYGNHSGFSMTSSTGVPPNSIRSFSSFLQAADENADSRVKAGIHFRFATVAGQEMGNKIGEWTVKNHLRRVK